MTPTATSANAPSGNGSPARFGWVWQSLSLIVSVGAAGAVLAVLYFEPYRAAEEDSGARTPATDQSVQITAAGALRIEPGSSLKDKLAFDKVRLVAVTTPLLTVTGAIAARLGPGPDHADARWDFITPDLASAYVDWLNARNNVAFTEKQLVLVREAARTNLDYKTEYVNLLEKLFKSGTDSKKDLNAARADLTATRIQGEKDVHEADTARRNAIRNRSTLERQLYQAGVDPELLVGAQDNLAIVVGEVPEAKAGLVAQGQECEAVFYAFPDDHVRGRLRSIAPTLSKERRTLRIFFELPDPKGHFKPGMFADVRLGTKPRKVLLIPSAAVLHVGKFDYVFAGGKNAESWDVVKVVLGEVHPLKRGEGGVEILSGLSEGRPVIGQGAILLKPYLIAALQKLAAEEPRHDAPSH